MTTTGFQGANPEQLDDLAGAFGRADRITAQALRRVESIARSEQGIRGPAGDDFRQSLAVVSRRLTVCAGRLAPMAAELRQHAEEQRRASSADGATAAVRTRGPAVPLVLTQAPVLPMPGPRGPLRPAVCVDGRCRTLETNQEFDDTVPERIRAFELRVIRDLFRDRFGDAVDLAALQADPNYHVFSNRTEIGRNVDRARVWHEYGRSPAPSEFLAPHSAPVRTGDTTLVNTWVRVTVPREVASVLLRFPVLVDIPLDLPAVGGEVRHEVDEQLQAIANVTLPWHLLHPGYAIRWIEEVQTPDGPVYYSHTVGRGTGGFSGMNQEQGPGIFHSLDLSIRRRLQR